MKGNKMNKVWIPASLIAALLLSGCANRSVNDVSVEDAGQSYKVKFGTVLEQHPVNIRSKGDAATGGGALLGAGAGAVAGNSGNAVLAGAVIGGILGAIAHNAAETNNGIEYTIAFADGTTQIIAQLQLKTDQVFQAGAPVMVQFGANINRVLSAANLPENVSRPKEVRVEGAPPPPANIGVQTCQTGFSWNSVRSACTSQ